MTSPITREHGHSEPGQHHADPHADGPWSPYQSLPTGCSRRTDRTRNTDRKDSFTAPMGVSERRNCASQKLYNGRFPS